MTDGEIHDVGLLPENLPFDGFNTPSLRNVYRKILFLHDGRVESLEELLSGPHDPATVSDTASLTAAEIKDLVAYLKTL